MKAIPGTGHSFNTAANKAYELIIRQERKEERPLTYFEIGELFRIFKIHDNEASRYGAKLAQIQAEEERKKWKTN